MEMDTNHVLLSDLGQPGQAYCFCPVFKILIFWAFLCFVASISIDLNSQNLCAVSIGLVNGTDTCKMAPLRALGQQASFVMSTVINSHVCAKLRSG
jgi:hypothetical protein